MDWNCPAGSSRDVPEKDIVDGCICCFKTSMYLSALMVAPSLFKLPVPRAITLIHTIADAMVCPKSQVNMSDQTLLHSVLEVCPSVRAFYAIKLCFLYVPSVDTGTFESQITQNSVPSHISVSMDHWL